MVRKHGKEPYHIVVLHGGPGATGSAFGLAKLISKEFGVLETMQSKYTIMELEEELMEQIEENCSGKVILAGHSWGAWLAGLFAERFPDKVEKVILIGCGPLDKAYVSQIGERRNGNMSSEEAEEFDQILRQMEEGFGEKDESLRRLGEICDRADGYQEEEYLRDKVEVNGELYEKVWKEAAPLPGEIVKEPELAVYITDFGQPDDLCLLAEACGHILGAAWTRILAGKVKGYGNVDDHTPEFAISVKKGFRSQGIGSKLM